MIQEMHGMKQTNNMLNERIQLVIKRAADAGDANKVLSSRLLSGMSMYLCVYVSIYLSIHVSN
jgi:hypothetical protein